MASPDHSSIVSPAGIIHVLGYTPTEGERGVPITVRIHFQPDLASAMYVRLVVGTKAVPTKVRLLPSVTYGRWQLHAAAPPFDKSLSPSTKVLISVQALNEENTILDSVTFGEFTYWASGIPLISPFFFLSHLQDPHKIVVILLPLYPGFRFPIQILCADVPTMFPLLLRPRFPHKMLLSEPALAFIAA